MEGVPRKNEKEEGSPKISVEKETPTKKRKLQEKTTDNITKG